MVEVVFVYNHEILLHPPQEEDVLWGNLSLYRIFLSQGRGLRRRAACPAGSWLFLDHSLIPRRVVLDVEPVRRCRRCRLLLARVGGCRQRSCKDMGSSAVQDACSVSLSRVKATRSSILTVPASVLRQPSEQPLARSFQSRGGSCRHRRSVPRAVARTHGPESSLNTSGAYPFARLFFTFFFKVGLFLSQQELT